MKESFENKEKVFNKENSIRLQENIVDFTEIRGKYVHYLITTILCYKDFSLPQIKRNTYMYISHVKKFQKLLLWQLPENSYIVAVSNRYKLKQH